MVITRFSVTVVQAYAPLLSFPCLSFSLRGSLALHLKGLWWDFLTLHDVLNVHFSDKHS